MTNSENNLVHLKTAYAAVDDKFGTDIMILDIHELSVLADYFIIATGANSSQIKAMADEVSEKLHKQGLVQRHIEGYNTANWILLDFSVIIVHIFDKDSRALYNIEEVWGNAPVIDATTL